MWADKDEPSIENLDPIAKKQIQQMTNFIKQEAMEKIYEIEAKTEEDYNLQKGKLIQNERIKIMKDYEKKEKNVIIQRNRLQASMEHQARLLILTERDKILREVLEEARTYLNGIADASKKLYENMLLLLIQEGLLMLNEPLVFIAVREKDKTLLRPMINYAAQLYKNTTGYACKLQIDHRNTLSEQNYGVILRDRQNKVIVDNTLNTRFNIAVEKLMPQLRIALFGKNPNRKFHD